MAFWIVAFLAWHVSFLFFSKGTHIFFAVCQAFWRSILSSGYAFLYFPGQTKAKLFFSVKVLYSGLYRLLWRRRRSNWGTLGWCCWCSGNPKDRREFQEISMGYSFFWPLIYSCRLSHMHILQFIHRIIKFTFSHPVASHRDYIPSF